MLLQQVDIDLALAQTEKDQVMMELTNFVTAYFFFTDIMRNANFFDRCDVLNWVQTVYCQNVSKGSL